MGMKARSMRGRRRLAAAVRSVSQSLSSTSLKSIPRQASREKRWPHGVPGFQLRGLRGVQSWSALLPSSGVPGFHANHKKTPYSV